MKRVPLTQGQFALVDDDDFERVSQYVWQADARVGNGPLNGWDAKTCVRQPDGRRRKLIMSRLITNAPVGSTVDHINGNSLDNRKANLRVTTAIQNSWNRKPNRNTLTGFKGVRKQNGSTYQVRITVHGVRVNVGNFPSAEAGARAYDAAARKHFGEYARLNFPDS